MNTFNFLYFFLLSTILISGTIYSQNMAFGEPEELTSIESIKIEGLFNILEIFYADGSMDHQYYLFVDDELSNSQIPYRLEFKDLDSSYFGLVSKQVVVNGTLKHSPSQFSISLSEVPISVDSIEQIDPEVSSVSASTISQTGVDGVAVPTTIQSFVIMSKFSNLPGNEPHDLEYFDNLFYNTTTGVPSLSNYYKEASYGLVNFTSAGIKDWALLSNSTGDYPAVNNTAPSNYIDFFTQDVINAAELSGAIDFNGPDDVIQNSSPSNLIIPGENGDDIDHLFFIYNGNTWGGCNCAFAFVGPFGIPTSQGLMFFLTSYQPDLSPALGGFSVDSGYRAGYGVPAHEVGHSFSWEHTPTPPPFGVSNKAYKDPWSVMSKISDTNLEDPASPTAFHRDHAKWIPVGDIKTVSNNQTETFTLDRLSAPSPGPGYLMAKIPFGVDGEFYTLEARIDSQFDNTPADKTGLLIYHVNPAGHPLSGEPPLVGEITWPIASIVDVNGALNDEDWDNANLAESDFYTANNVTITNLSQNSTSITVQVENNVSSPASCSPPGAGNWVITVSCTMTANGTAAGNVVIQNGSVLTIPSGITLTVPTGFGITVLSGGGVLIALGGTLIIIS